MDKKSAVVTFIETERANGKSDTSIQHKLLDAGWQMDIIQWAMGQIAGERAQPHAASTSPSHKHRRELLFGGGVAFALAMGLRKAYRQSKH